MIKDQRIKLLDTDIWISDFCLDLTDSIYIYIIYSILHTMYYIHILLNLLNKVHTWMIDSVGR